MFDFSDQVVLVTGAAGNLGAVVTKAYQKAGAKLALVERDMDRMVTLFPDMDSSPDYLLIDSIDITSVDSVARMAQIVIEHFKRIDVLVCTVGGYRAGTPLHETPVETWDFMQNLNARSVFITCQAVIPHMLKHGSGKIISIAARPGLKGGRNMAAYSASKSAVIRLTESMSAELKRKNINVNCVLPGTIDTPQNRQAMPDADFANWVAPQAIADAILFLSSRAGRAVQGAALPVTGKS
jgi:NAD(P)-dependent dehydrogenase (short-subunit alcohol dehydrogenase family)